MPPKKGDVNEPKTYTINSIKEYDLFKLHPKNLENIILNHKFISIEENEIIIKYNDNLITLKERDRLNIYSNNQDGKYLSKFSFIVCKDYKEELDLLIINRKICENGLWLSMYSNGDIFIPSHIKNPINYFNVLSHTNSDDFIKAKNIIFDIESHEDFICEYTKSNIDKYYFIYYNYETNKIYGHANNNGNISYDEEII